MWDLTAMQIKNSSSPNKNATMSLYISSTLYIYKCIHSIFFTSFLISHIIPLPWVCLEWSRSQKWSWEDQQKDTQHNYLLK